MGEECLETRSGSVKGQFSRAHRNTHRAAGTKLCFTLIISCVFFLFLPVIFLGGILFKVAVFRVGGCSSQS